MERDDNNDNKISNLFNDLQCALNRNENYDPKLKSDLKKLFLYNDLLTAPCESIDESYCLHEFAKFFLSLDDEVLKEKIRMMIDQLVIEAQPDLLEKPRYFINLLEAAKYLKIKRNIYDIILSNLYNMRFELKNLKGIDIHLPMIRYAASFEVTSEYKKKILDICQENIKYSDYAPIAYRWAYEIDHSKAITWMDKLIDILGSRKDGKHEILAELMRVFDMTWIYEIFEANINYFLNEVYPKLIIFDLDRELYGLGVKIILQDFDIGETPATIINISINKKYNFHFALEDENLYKKFYDSLQCKSITRSVADMNLDFEMNIKKLMKINEARYEF